MHSCAGRLLIGDCRERLRDLPDASIDAVVTDPPYELGFMGKAWDAAGVAYDVALWAEVLRVLKPGGHLLAFGGTRTYHRMACAIEDAGFEIRDSIHWLYGSGFPKSLDVSKAIDKAGGKRAGFAEFRDAVKDAMKRNNVSRKSMESALGNYMLGHYLTAGSQPAVPNYRDYVIIRDHVGLGDTFDDLFAPEAEREVVGRGESGVAAAFGDGQWATPEERAASTSNVYDITAPATDAARQWSGWGTALKPAHEPIVVARKPLVGTVAGNVLEHGTGALNIDGCRVAHDEECRTMAPQQNGLHNEKLRQGGRHSEVLELKPEGRWPANLVLTHSADCTDTCAPDCPVAALDAQSGMSLSKASVGRQTPKRSTTALGDFAGTDNAAGHNDSVGASRFFTTTGHDPIADVVPFRYVAKPAKRERNAGLDGLDDVPGGSLEGGNDKRKGDRPQLQPTKNHHPTVKPLALMRWLVRLVTPPGGVVLDPFLGSGTTAVAAILEGFDWRGCEMTAEFLPIIEGRVGGIEGTTRARSAVVSAMHEPLQLQLI